MYGFDPFYGFHYILCENLQKTPSACQKKACKNPEMSQKSPTDYATDPNVVHCVSFDPLEQITITSYAKHDS